MIATLLTLSLLANAPKQTVYLHRSFPPNVRDTYSVSITVNGNTTLTGRLRATTSPTEANTRLLAFADVKTLNGKNGIRDQVVGIFDQNSLPANGSYLDLSPLYTAFSLASFVPVGAIALDGSAGTSYENDRLKFTAMSHVENGSDPYAYANVESILTIEPKGSAAMQVAVRNTLEVKTGRMDKAHVEIQGAQQSRIVADFQLIESKGN